MTRRHSEQGIGLVEVMIALAILLLTALATGTLQSTGLISARASSDHFAIDHLSNEILETLRSHPIDAEAGLLDFDPSSITATDAHTEVSSWTQRIANSLPSGEGEISCVAGFCDVTISWMEEIDGTNHRQFYTTRTPL